MSVGSLDNRFHQFFIVGRWRTCVQAGVLGDFELEFEDITVLISDCGNIPRGLSIDTCITEFNYRNKVRSQLSQLGVVTLCQ